MDRWQCMPMPLQTQRPTPTLQLHGSWQKLPIFAGVSPEVLADIEALAERRRFPRTHVLIEQGACESDMYIVLAGEVRVIAESSLHDTRFERHLVAPAVVGEIALITREPRTATVHCETDIIALCVTRGALDTLLRTHAEINSILTSVVGQRLLEADTIAHVGKYEVTGRLGSGAMATVFEGMHPTLERPVALKMLSHRLANDGSFAGSFRREARLIARLDHENIVRVYDTVEAYGTQFIVMEKLTGTTLDKLIRDNPELGWGVVRRLLREICLALHYSHEQGLLHRDVKPSNVFLTADRRVKLLDFGIAVPHEASAPGDRGLVGTPWYMSPEHIMGQTLDGRADQYSLGILAYQVICGRVPFDSKANIQDLWRQHLKVPMPDPRDLVEEVPDDLAEFVLKTTAKKRADRFEDCRGAFDFLQAAGEAPLVDRFRLATIAVSYHPSRSAEVQAAVDALIDALDGLGGVAVKAFA